MRNIMLVPILPTKSAETGVIASLNARNPEVSEGMKKLKLIPHHNLSYEAACQIVNSTLEAASRLEKNVSVAVVDGSGHLVAFGRSNTAALLSINVAIDKAYTAAISRIPTHKWQETILTDEPIRNAVPGAIPRLMAVGGGQLIWHEGNIIGAIGVSGAHWDGDRDLGEQVLRRFGLFEVSDVS